MRARLEVFTVLLRIRMELYGPAHPVVCGDSIKQHGSISELSGTPQQGLFRSLDLIHRGYCGRWWVLSVPRRTLSTLCRVPDDSKQPEGIYQLRGLHTTPIDSS